MATNASLFGGLAALLVLAPAAHGQGEPESVATFQSEHPQTGTYTLSAYVVDIYLCPPCPAGAMCKPCIPENITLSDVSSLPEASASHRPTLRVFIEPSQATALTVGRRYELRVQAGPSPQLLTAQPAR